MSAPSKASLPLVARPLLLLAFWAPAAWAQQPIEDRLATAEGVVQELYDLVTFPAGETPDWYAVRELFIQDAIIALRTTREGTTLFSVDAFVDDFVSFIERARADTTGFTERIIRTSPTVMGDMAHVLVLYEASIPGWRRTPQKGVDSFSLIKKGGRWWIVSVTNEIPTPSRPIPDSLRD